MLRLAVYAVVALVAIGALLAGTLPNSPASVVHDAIAGWRRQFEPSPLKHFCPRS